jgi:hypothetical protein
MKLAITLLIKYEFQDWVKIHLVVALERKDTYY